MKKNSKKLGFLQMCADRRFHAKMEEEFRRLTGLSETDYWIEATAGGAPAISDPKTADYADSHGARFMGWAAHGTNCGGFPGISDESMEARLDETIRDRQSRYPDATHLKIFSTDQETHGEKVD